MKFLYLAFLITTGIFASSCSDKTAKSVEYYKIHNDLAQNTLQNCNIVDVKNDASKADCENAQLGLDAAINDPDASTNT